MRYEKNTNRMNCPNILPFTNNQDKFFSPEEANIFEIKSYWLKKSDTHYFFTETNLKNIFIKDNEILFLIHPESESFYENVNKDKPGPIFKGLATSSSRTVLLFLNDKPICFAKLSLNKILGEKIRTLKISETTRSVGITMILDDLENKNKLPNNFKYFREVISFIPKNFERGGMIIREIHEDLYKNNFHLMPGFSIFTKQENNIIPLFILSDKYNMSVENFIYFKIIVPFVDQHLFLGKLGISVQPHSQNLLINFKNNEVYFYHRDLGGFNIDIKTTEIELPYLNNLNDEYLQNKYNFMLKTNLFVYFEGSVIYGLSKVSNISYERLKFMFRYYLKNKLMNHGIRATNENIKEKIIYFFKNY